ncbi:MAG: hypothetical protein U5L00_07700 [Desulfovermiculus sp.]|nr:hypothetical protein [Desulfovermiculus sp.]
METQYASKFYGPYIPRLVREWHWIDEFLSFYEDGRYHFDMVQEAFEIYQKGHCPGVVCDGQRLLHRDVFATEGSLRVFCPACFHYLFMRKPEVCFVCEEDISRFSPIGPWYVEENHLCRETDSCRAKWALMCSIILGVAHEIFLGEYIEPPN